MPNEIRKPSLEGKEEGGEGRKGPSQSSKLWLSNSLSSHSRLEGQESPGSATYKPKDSTVHDTAIVSTQEYTSEAREAIKNDKEKEEQLDENKRFEHAYDVLHTVSTSHHFSIENEISEWRYSKPENGRVYAMAE